MKQIGILRREIRRWLKFFIAALLISGITAFPIETGLGILGIIPLLICYLKIRTLEKLETSIQSGQQQRGLNLCLSVIPAFKLQ